MFAGTSFAACRVRFCTTQSLLHIAILIAATSLPASAIAVDTDGDGLLDLLDVPGFDPNASGTRSFFDQDIQDLDGANLLTNLQALRLDRNQLVDLNFAGATFGSLRSCNFPEGLCFADDRVNISSLTLDETTLSQQSFEAIHSEIRRISHVSLVHLRFSDGAPDDLDGLLQIDSLANVSVDPELYSQYADEFVAFDALEGKTLTIIPDGDFNRDTFVTVADMDTLTTAVRESPRDPVFDLNDDGVASGDDRTMWVHDIKRTYFGDANLDGEFTSRDFTQVFLAGEYEDAIEDNSGWGEGDWDGDGDFTSADFVAAFLDGGYEQGPRPAVAVPEGSSVLTLIIGLVIAPICCRRQHRESRSFGDPVQRIGRGDSRRSRCLIETKRPTVGRRSHVEQMEPRLCLSTVTFLPGNRIVTWAASELGEVHAGEIDGDGHIDLLVTYPTDFTLLFRNVDGEGTFAAARDNPGTHPDPLLQQGIDLADLDGDGDADLLIADFFQERIIWMENSDGQGTFNVKLPGSLIDLAFGRAPSWIEAIDMDGDQDLDVLAVETVVTNCCEIPKDTRGSIRWYENLDGQGTFGESQRIIDDVGAQYGRFFAVVAADVDGDSDLDIISRPTSVFLELAVEPRLFWYENMGNNTDFGPPQGIHRDRGQAYSLHAADIDRDGDVDLISVTGFNAPGESSRVDVVAYDNLDGAGTFGPPIVIDVLDDNLDAVRNAWVGPSSTIDDLDGDGDVDIVAIGYANGALNWYENLNGPGSFTRGISIVDSPAKGRSVLTADLDGDGDSDIIARFDDGVTWFENRVIGDSNDDGVFDSSDFVKVFLAGKYEDGIDHNATFDEGDWNQDGDFDSGDFIFAFKAGHYESPPARSIDASVAAAVDALFDNDDATKHRRSGASVP